MLGRSKLLRRTFALIRLTISVWLLIVSIVLGRVLAAYDRPEVVYFTTYVSKSGQYQLEVDPSDILGRGSGRYRLLENGKEVWALELPFTFFDAVVTDDGSAIGYAYQHGYDGIPVKGGYDAGAGDLQVAIIDPKGNLRLNEFTKRERTGVLHGSPDPRANGILLNESEGIATIRTHSDSIQTWWPYRIADGKALRHVTPRGPEKVVRALWETEKGTSLPGLPLFLMSKLVRDSEKEQFGAIFFLMDQSGNCVWSLEKPDAYVVEKDKVESRRLQKLAAEKGAVLDAKSDGRFDLWFAAEAQRVSFQVTRDESVPQGWKVIEIGRKSFTRPPEPVTPEPEPATLKHLGRFQLNAAAPADAEQRIDWFEFGTNGNIGSLRRELGSNRMTFILSDAAGKALAEVPVPKMEKSDRSDTFAAFVGQGKWVILNSDNAGTIPSEARWYDEMKESLSEPIAVDCPDVDAIVGTGDCGFVALGKRDQKYSLTHEITAFDGSGKRRWKLGEAGYDDKPSSLLSPKDITLMQGGELAVLDVIRHTVQFFDLNGKFLRIVDLEKTWGREPSYPTNIMPTADGGFIVYDFEGPQRFVRMRADGTVLSPMKPRDRDGREIDTDKLRLAPDGHYWATDHHGLFRLDESENADLLLGREPNSGTLATIESVTTDGHDRLYALDAQTAAVHVFDGEGNRLHISTPSPGDFPESLHSPSIKVDQAGGLYLHAAPEERDSKGPERWLYFTPDGNRKGFREVKFADGRISSRDWKWQSPKGDIVAPEFHVVTIGRSDGTILREIRRRSDRLWINCAADVAVAQDGSFAVLSESIGYKDLRAAVAFYSKDGDPVSTLPIPNRMSLLLGYNGNHVVLSQPGTVRIYEARGKAVFQLPEGDWDNRQQILLARGGRELWAVDFRTRVVQRYAMP